MAVTAHPTLATFTSVAAVANALIIHRSVARARADRAVEKGGQQSHWQQHQGQQNQWQQYQGKGGKTKGKGGKNKGKGWGNYY